MPNDHEERQRRREIRVPSDYTTEELVQNVEKFEKEVRQLKSGIEKHIQKMKTLEKRVRHHQCSIALWQGVIGLRQAQLDKASGNVHILDAQKDTECLFLDDSTDKLTKRSGNEKVDNDTTAEHITAPTTPPQPVSIPTQACPSNPFDASTLPECKLRRDPRKVRANKLNELLGSHSPEELRLWLEFTNWFNDAYRVDTLKFLEPNEKRKDDLDTAMQAVDLQATPVKQGSTPPLKPGIGANGRPFTEATTHVIHMADASSLAEGGYKSNGNSNGNSNGTSKMKSNGTSHGNDNSRNRTHGPDTPARTPHGHASHSRKSWQGRSSGSYGPSSNGQGRRTFPHEGRGQHPPRGSGNGNGKDNGINERDARGLKRRRSPSPSYARGARRSTDLESEVDPRRGTPRRRERLRLDRTDASPSPPGRRNQRVSPVPRTPPRRDGIVVGSAGGWGIEGGFDHGHGWMSHFKPST